MEYFAQDRLRFERAKRAFSTRRAPVADMAMLLRGNLRPAAGDLVLARVDLLGKQTRLELTDGRRAYMFPGDEILVAYGNRYAPDQFEAMVGIDLSPCDLVAAGGIAAIEIARHDRMKPPTQITPIGLVGNEAGERLNLMDYPVEAKLTRPEIPVILSIGTSMNAGKTLSAASMVRGLKRLGYKVAALKITGTGSGGDLWIVEDAGADVVLDFTDAGFASTYMTDVEDIVQGAYRLINHAADLGCEIAVIEIADGVQQLETGPLVRHPSILDIAIGTVFSAYDSMGAMCGAHILREAGHRLMGLGGRIGRSPLAVREAEASTGLRYFSPVDLQAGALVPLIRQCAVERLARADDRLDSALRRIAGDLDIAGAQNGVIQFGPDQSPERTNGTATLAAPTPVNGVHRDAPGSETRNGAHSITVAFTQAQHGAGDELDLPRMLLATIAEFIMAHDLINLCGASMGSRAAGRANRRNGRRIRRWECGVGTIELAVPRLRFGGYTPRFFGKTVPECDVDALILHAGAPRFAVTLSRLVLHLGGPGFDQVDLTPLRDQLLTILSPVIESTGAARRDANGAQARLQGRTGLPDIPDEQGLFHELDGPDGDWTLEEFSQGFTEGIEIARPVSPKKEGVPARGTQAAE